jgi:predicted Abi (CAAX) family protease
LAANPALPTRILDLLASIRSLPSGAGWRRTALELAWALPLLLIVAHLGGLAHLQAPPDALTSLRLGAMLFLAPALGEELLFRGLLIPRDGGKRAWMAISVVLFVLWHPLQAVTFGPPWAAVFLDPWFLADAAILGLALARIYAATGSLWPCVLTHWLVVLGWKTLFAGSF